MSDVLRTWVLVWEFVEHIDVGLTGGTVDLQIDTFLFSISRHLIPALLETRCSPTMVQCVLKAQTHTHTHTPFLSGVGLVPAMKKIPRALVVVQNLV